ncbi:hypothetical protein CP083_01995 [Candidatus Bathyarchaeota archaeon B24-2]|nr:MAG: hypothetical protein CP083_01995 [Candidatus Bathyarchaeota archaeon B24-2]
MPSATSFIRDTSYGIPPPSLNSTSGGKFAIIEPSAGYRWRVNEDLKRKLENFGLKNVKIYPRDDGYPKKRNVYIIYGEKEGKK